MPIPTLTWYRHPPGGDRVLLREAPGTEVTLEYMPEGSHDGDSLYCVASQPMETSNHGDEMESHYLVLDIHVLCEYPVLYVRVHVRVLYISELL